jgi:uncharacterized protein
MKGIEPVKLVLLKLANTCNLNCTYCYWFKDKSVYEGSKIIKDIVLEAFYTKLRAHIVLYNLKSFTVILHGGEPMLAGKKRVESILFNLYKIQSDLDIEIKMSIQTNGLLIDNDWIDIFKSFNVNIGISIDGPKEIHDKYRKDLRGAPTFDKTVNNIKLLQARNLNFGILAVCNNAYNAERFCDFFINQLGVKIFDILIPNANFESDEIPDIKDFYIELFKLWHEKYNKQGIRINIAKNILNGILGVQSRMQSVGYNSVEIFMIKPDGEMESVDFLHAIGYNFTKSNLNILNNEINDINRDALWKEVYESSLKLNSKCQGCRFQFPCGGGHIGTRWSKEKRFDNPSVYCDQLFEIFRYASDLVLSKSVLPL